MSTHANRAQVLLRCNARETLLAHTTRVSILLVVSAKSAEKPIFKGLPDRYHNAIVNTSLRTLIHPSFRDQNPDIVAITHPKLQAVDKAVLTNDFLHLHVQQRTFFSLGIPAASRAGDHEPRFVSIPRTSKQPNSRACSSLEALGPSLLLLSTGSAPLRIPFSVKGNVVLEQGEIKLETKQLCASSGTILNAQPILKAQEEQDTLQLIDQIQQLIYNSQETVWSEEVSSGAPVLLEEMNVSITTYNGYCTPRLANDAIKSARSTVQKLCEEAQSNVWGAVMAVAPHSSPITWRVSSSKNLSSTGLQSRTRAAEMFIITKDHCVGAQMKDA